MSNLTLVTDNMLPVANETFIDNLSAGISAGAAIVPINSLAEYADGDSVVLTVDPGTASQATFIGEKQGNTVIDCKWTEGNVGASHAAGATVIDYDSSTHYNVVTKLLRMFANENGSLKTTAVQAALNISSAVPADWTPLATAASVTSTDGNRSQQLTFTGVDYRDRIGLGTKLRVPRVGTQPTQMMRFIAANNQYASKSGPAGFTFTDDFTMEAIINPDLYSKYTTGNGMGIIAKRQGDTNGFSLALSASGQVELTVLNGGAYRSWTSYQAVSLFRNTHIAVTADISAGIYLVYIDGIAIPGYLTTSGSMTAITQPNLPYVIGSRKSDAFLELFTGAISEVRTWSVVRTGQQIRDNMNKQIAAQAGLVAYHKGNGDWNDTTANANNLTANGGAVNNSVENLFNATEYAIVTKVDYTAGNTVLNVFTGDKCTLPTDTLGAVSYSNLDRPYGFPADRGLWAVEVPFIAANPAGTGGVSPSNIGNVMIYVPVGAWKMKPSMSTQTYWSGAMTHIGSVHGFSTNNTTLASPAPKTIRTFLDYTTYLDVVYEYEFPISVTTMTPYYYMAKFFNANTSMIQLNADQSVSVLRLECAYI